jgi:twitching motility protein PilT
MVFFHNLLKSAIDQGASDVHIKPDHCATLRIAGTLVPVTTAPPSKELVAEFVRQILPAHQVERLAREKEVDFSYLHDNRWRFRVNVFHQRGNLCLAMRSVRNKIPSFIDLHMPEQLAKIAASENGIVFVTGVTGSGKSSTMAAMVESINLSDKCHIVTLEDPIEYIFEDKQSVIEQREIGLDTTSFASALVHVLRQDPDVIMVGEMRDSQSFMAALAASDTGHLVLTTLHTTTASSAIGRVLDFFPADERDQIRRQIAVNLRAIICQRLVPSVSGGVVPAVEILINTPTVRKFIEENRLDKLSAVIETGNEDGMQTFNHALMKLVKAKLITEAEALSKATNPEALKMNLRGIFLDESRRILSSA